MLIILINVTFNAFRALLGPHGGHVYHLYNFESPTPKDDYWQVLLKSDHGCFFKKMKITFFITCRTPLPKIFTPTGA